MGYVEVVSAIYRGGVFTRTSMSWPAVSGASSRYKPTKCCASFRSSISSTWSRTKYKRSKREINVGGRSMFLVMVKSTSYLEPTGFAAAKIDVRAFKVVIIPALAIETVCCSWWTPDQSRISFTFADVPSLRAAHFASRLTSCRTRQCNKHHRRSEQGHRCGRVVSGHHHPEFPATNLSSTSCFESGSRVTYAVKPTADDPFPEV